MPGTEIQSQETLHDLYGDANERAAKKQMDKLDKHSRHFISLSPFFVLATSGPNGTDASPRGDAPGFVTVVDDHTLIVPDRMGNNRVDSMSNIVENPNVGLLFLLPGMSETLRINGRARVTTDPELLEPMSVRGRAPQSGLIVEVDEVFMHCAKALMRSHLWDSERHIERSSFPTLGQIFKDQIADVDDTDEADRAIQEGYVTRLY
jgi:PPOX class probable FMN-dependent enzyme